MLRPLKITVGNMIVNAIISFYWQTQRERHVKPHPTEILTHCHILTFSTFCPEAATVFWYGTYVGFLFFGHFHCSASLAITAYNTRQSQDPHRWTVQSFRNDKGLLGSESWGMRICWRFSRKIIISHRNYLSSTFTFSFVGNQFIP